jgi:hypothetical protein
MRVSVITLVLLAALLTGCGDLPSLEGVANQNNTVFDSSLVGAWNAGDAVVIVQGSEAVAGEVQTYRISWLGAEGSDPPRIARMEGKLVKIGDQQILDLNSSDPGAFAIPCHVFLRVRPMKDGLKVQFVDSAWIREQVRASSLASFAFEGNPVLSARAAEVEAFLVKFGLDERALDDPMLLRPLKQK